MPNGDGNHQQKESNGSPDTPTPTQTPRSATERSPSPRHQQRSTTERSPPNPSQQQRRQAQGTTKTRTQRASTTRPSHSSTNSFITLVYITEHQIWRRALHPKPSATNNHYPPLSRSKPYPAYPKPEQHRTPARAMGWPHNTPTTEQQPPQQNSEEPPDPATSAPKTLQPLNTYAHAPPHQQLHQP